MLVSRVVVGVGWVSSRRGKGASEASEVTSIRPQLSPRPCPNPSPDQPLLDCLRRWTLTISQRSFSLS